MHLADGSPLPSFIFPNFATNTLTVVDDGTLKVERVTVIIKGNVAGYSDSLIVMIDIKPSTSSQDLSKIGFQLPHVSLTVYGN